VCDINAQLIHKWNANQIPFYEPDLAHYLAKAKQMNNLTFTTNTDQAMATGHVQIIAVNTPPQPVKLGQPLTALKEGK